MQRTKFSLPMILTLCMTLTITNCARPDKPTRLTNAPATTPTQRADAPMAMSSCANVQLPRDWTYYAWDYIDHGYRNGATWNPNVWYHLDITAHGIRRCYGNRQTDGKNECECGTDPIPYVQPRTDNKGDHVSID